MSIKRLLTPKVIAALSDTPIVLLNGATQVGKTTLVRSLAESGWGTAKPFYTTLDDPLSRSLAESDPDGFIRREEPMIIDEIQTVPDLLRAIKLSIDSDRRPGRFLLTGSADVFTLPTAGESLAGRMEIRALWPFAQAEIAGRKRSLVDELFSDDPIEAPRSSSFNVMDHVVRGGYPEAIVRENPDRRDEWFESYVMTILQRDVRELASIERLSDMPRLLQLIAARTATLANYSELSRTLGIPNSSLKRYLVLLEATFLVRQLPAWSANLSKRLVRSPKIHVTDTGLASSLLNVTADDTTSLVRGQLIETFVMNEIEKHRGWASTRTSLYHYRTHTGQEVDLVLEDRKGRIVGIEIKGKSTLQAADFRGLESLREDVGERFHRGVVLYEGGEVREGAGGSVGVPIRWV